MLSILREDNQIIAVNKPAPLLTQAPPGIPSLEAMVKAWMHSSPHRHVLLDSKLRNVGIGLVWGSPTSPGARAATYTADFGFKRG